VNKFAYIASEGPSNRLIKLAAEKNIELVQVNMFGRAKPANGVTRKILAPYVGIITTHISVGLEYINSHIIGWVEYGDVTTKSCREIFDAYEIHLVDRRDLEYRN